MIKLHFQEQKCSVHADKCGIEIYSNRRAFVFTGNVYEKYNSINQDSDPLIELYKFLAPNNNKKDSNSNVFKVYIK